MPKAPILSTPSVLTALSKLWLNHGGEPPVSHGGTGRYLSPGQIMAVLLAARGYTCGGHAALLSCSLLTGIPPADLCHACRDEIFTEDGTLITYSEISGQFECHALTKPAIAFLDRWMQNTVSHTGLIFELYGERIDLDILEEALDTLGQLAGIDNLTVDDLLCSHEYIALVSALVDTAPASASVEVAAMPRPLDHC